MSSAKDHQYIGHMTPSVDVSLLSCDYYFKVSFEHKGLTLGSHIPPVTMPITIVSVDHEKDDIL